MAILQIDSDLLSLTPVGTRNNPANRALAALCCDRFSVAALTAAADIGSTFRLCTLPANGRLLLALSKIHSTAAGAGALLTLGYASYRGSNGEVVPAAPAFFGTAFSVVAAGKAFLDTMTGAVEEWDVPTNVVLTASVTGAQLPIGFSFGGTIVYSAAFIG